VAYSSCSRDWLAKLVGIVSIAFSAKLLQAQGKGGNAASNPLDAESSKTGRDWLGLLDPPYSESSWELLSEGYSVKKLLSKFLWNNVATV
jgi:hypothetical protein